MDSILDLLRYLFLSIFIIFKSIGSLKDDPFVIDAMRGISILKGHLFFLFYLFYLNFQGFHEVISFCDLVVNLVMRLSELMMMKLSFVWPCGRGVGS